MPGHACEVLRFPPPFRAALAIASDIDHATPDYFARLHDFLNGTGETPWGRGLGLDIADSFWFYSANPEGTGGMSFYAGTSEAEKDAGAIRRGVAEGRIDSLHAWGDFSLAGGFRREMAERALARSGVSVPVWINHGDDHNFQNVLAPGSYGDVPEKKSAGGWPSRPLEYHTDLFDRAGVRFVWAGDLTRVIGQERPCTAWEHYRAHRTGTRASPSVAWLLDRLARAAGSTLAARACRRGIEYLGYPVMDGNALAWIERLRDGRPVWRFRRLGDFTRDCVEDLEQALDGEVLDRLVAQGGMSVLFTHFGKSRAAGGSARELPSGAVEGLRRLARWRDEGKIRVVRTARLLRHAVVLARVSARLEEDRLFLEWEDDPVLGRLGTAEDLSGLAIRTGESPVGRVLSGGRELAGGAWRVNGSGAGRWIGFTDGGSGAGGKA